MVNNDLLLYCLLQQSETPKGKKKRGPAVNGKNEEDDKIQKATEEREEKRSKEGEGVAQGGQEQHLHDYGSIVSRKIREEEHGVSRVGRRG